MPTIILLGNKLSYSALDSRKNSGLKMMLLQWYFSRMEAVYPTGTVDLMTMIALGFAFMTSSITFSTAAVLKCWVTES